MTQTPEEERWRRYQEFFSHGHGHTIVGIVYDEPDSNIKDFAYTIKEPQVVKPTEFKQILKWFTTFLYGSVKFYRSENLYLFIMVHTHEWVTFPDKTEYSPEDRAGIERLL